MERVSLFMDCSQVNSVTIKAYMTIKGYTRVYGPMIRSRASASKGLLMVRYTMVIIIKINLMAKESLPILRDKSTRENG